MSEGTEAPTPRRLRKAREEGQLARSRLLSAALPVLAGALALQSTAADAGPALRAWATRLWAEPGTAPAAALEGFGLLLARLAAPPLAAATVGAVLGGALQAGLHLHPALAAPKLERVDPLGALRRMLGQDARVGLLRGAAGALLLLAWGWVRGRDEVALALRALAGEGPDQVPVLLERLVDVLAEGAALALALGLLDLALARWLHRRSLRMTRDEVRREHKQAEGDPHQRARRRALHRQLAQGGGGRGVASASVVVVNPTHLAVGLRYAESECDAPYVVARGRGRDAAAIRAAARRAGVPVVRDVPLARSLIHYDVGEEIPEELYRAAAAVLKVALERSAGAPSPGGPS